MALVSDLLIARMEAWAAAAGVDFDATDALFVREVLEPISQLLGESLPVSDPRRLLAARLQEEAPDIDGTVFADVAGKVMAHLFLPLYSETRANLSRRRLDDEKLLTGSDLADQRDFFVVPPSEGGYSSGDLRVFYPTARAVVVSPAMRVSVAGRDGRPARLYRPASPRVFPLSEVRANKSGDRFYVDVPVVATAAGEEYDLSPGEAQGASGFPGSVFVTNRGGVEGGRSADSAATLLDRIRTSVVLRSPSSFAGLEYMLREKGFTYFFVAAPGDPLLLRDRVYGPGTIAGIPGGFQTEPSPVPSSGDTPYVRLGVAFDVWIQGRQAGSYVAAQVSQLENEGAEILVGDGGTLSWDSAEPVGSQYTLSTTGFRFTEVVGVGDMFPAYPGGLLPVREGDWVVFEGVFASPSDGRRLVFEVVVVVSGKELRLNPVTPIDPTSFGDYVAPTAPALPTYRFTGSRWSVRRGMGQSFSEDDVTFQYPALTAPLTDARALDGTGAELEASGYPALAKPGSTWAETVSAVRVPRTTNVLVEASTAPVLYPIRAEVGDALTQAPSEAYLYPHRYLFAEFVRSTSGAAASKAVLARVHLLGPQAYAFPPACLFRDQSDVTRMYPMSWTYEGAVSVGSGSDTDEIEVPAVGPTLSDALAHGSGASVVGRVPAPGDWAHFYVGEGDEYFLPIVTVGASSVTVAAPDIPVGVEGTLRVYQGTSRDAQLLSGRGPEGTYSVDVWLRESSEAGYSPSDPPQGGTAVSVDVATMLSQGYEMVSPLPGQQGSAQERASLMLMGARANDREQMDGRSVYLHTPDARDLVQVQTELESAASRPLAKSGLARLYTPAYAVFSVYFVADTLTAEQAATAAAAVFDGAQRDGRLEVSDIVAAVGQAGATFTANGRVFVLRMNHLRQWDSFADKSAVPLYRTTRLVLSAITAVRLFAPEQGTVIDLHDPSLWRETYTLRAGGFDAD